MLYGALLILLVSVKPISDWRSEFGTDLSVPNEAVRQEENLQGEGWEMLDNEPMPIAGSGTLSIASTDGSFNELKVDGRNGNEVIDSTSGDSEIHEDTEVSNRATLIYSAMQSFGYDVDALTLLLSNVSEPEMDNLKATFKKLYDVPLGRMLGSETSGPFGSLVVGLTLTSAEFYADWIHSSISGWLSNKGAVIEALCGRSNSDLKDIKRAYELRHRTKMIKDFEDRLRFT
jgi:Annexin